VSFVYIKRSRLPFTGITPPHMCAYPNPEPGFPKSCCVQRVKLTQIDENIEKEIRNNSKFEIVSSHGTSASRGVSILLNMSLPF
jgi:hypothetical protein